LLLNSNGSKQKSSKCSLKHSYIGPYRIHPSTGNIDRFQAIITEFKRFKAKVTK